MTFVFGKATSTCIRSWAGFVLGLGVELGLGVWLVVNLGLGVLLGLGVGLGVGQGWRSGCDYVFGKKTSAQ